MWRTCIHNDVISDFVEGKLDIQKSAHITTAKLSITPKLFAELSKKNGKNSFFQQWITSLTGLNTISIHKPDDCPLAIKNLTNPSLDYFAASYFSGSQIIVPPQHTICHLTANKVGCQLIDTTTLDPNKINLTEQLKKIVLQVNGDADYNIIDNLFLPEDEIIIYDKFINSVSMDFISHIAKSMLSNSRITIFTSPKKNNTKSTSEITSELTSVNSSIIIESHIASRDFIKKHHDRYIFLGNRIQINFTGGLDSFGVKDLSTGKRRNKYSFINIYEIQNKPYLEIESINPLNNKYVRYFDK